MFLSFSFSPFLLFFFEFDLVGETLPHIFLADQHLLREKEKEKKKEKEKEKGKGKGKGKEKEKEEKEIEQKEIIWVDFHAFREYVEQIHHSSIPGSLLFRFFFLSFLFLFPFSFPFLFHLKILIINWQNQQFFKILFLLFKNLICEILPSALFLLLLLRLLFPLLPLLLSLFLFLQSFGKVNFTFFLLFFTEFIFFIF